MNGTLPWDDRAQPPSADEMHAYALEHGIRERAPQGALALGCRDCRAGDRFRHPELGMVYCGVCPVTIRRDGR